MAGRDAHRHFLKNKKPPRSDQGKRDGKNYHEQINKKSRRVKRPRSASQVFARAAARPTESFG
jgi:hypothetical protein